MDGHIRGRSLVRQPQPDNLRSPVGDAVVAEVCSPLLQRYRVAPSRCRPRTFSMTRGIGIRFVPTETDKRIIKINEDLQISPRLTTPRGSLYEYRRNNGLNANILA
jgi:hypothetical protein